MRVLIDGKATTLDKQTVIGVGGEATVFKHDGKAIKLYLVPDRERSRKLQAMLPITHMLPPQVIAPQQLVYDDRGKQVIGFTMRLLESDYQEVRMLASKKYRAKSGLHSRDVAQLFLNTHHSLAAIHRAGAVVGDLNDLNLMFRDFEVLFIDADSFQFDQYPCMVGTEAFIDPALYGCDLSKGMLYRADNDWYSYAIHLFKSLLLTHPYGGVHPQINLMTKRAIKGITVFHADVKYPRIAYNPELLSDDLMQEFEEWFVHGKRGIFPENIIHDYMEHLNTCPSCGATYPVNRGACPMCATVVPVVPLPASQFKPLIETQGQIIAYHIEGTSIRVIAYEDDKAVLYHYDGSPNPRRLTLFDAIPNATYAFMGDVLVVSPDISSHDLMLLDVSGAKPAPLLRTTTGRYGDSRPVFGANGRSFYRLAGGYLMRGYVENGQLIEQAVMSIADHQTWLQVAPDSEQVFGFFRTFNEYTHFLLVDQKHVDAQITPLEQGEFLIESSVRFDKASVLFMRRTQLQGVERIRIDEIDHNGFSLRSIMTTQVEDFVTIDSHAYVRNVLVYPTENGITQQRLDNRTTRTFPQTEPVTRHSNAVAAYQQGLAMMLDNRVIYVTVR